ncbi:uncharacterized protein CPUR_03473 [Claviceps purpurea 20.1]|uniref:Uncharacterized protein n=1 Tax=Claviceps purpurea (strain 20.1) TaxID=1111077 RepID=M1W0K8_CLAP2|nr:uncharacterized protein CPUR_03473 [Claviceps purpurea 20.1]
MTKQLGSFDIVFPDESTTAIGRVGDASIRHLKAYEWARGAPSIHTMGCHHFRFRSDPKNDEDLPLPQFLASFPNLRTLEIYSAQYSYEPSEFVNVVVAIMKRTHLKTIYTTDVEGAALGQLKQAAREHDVELIDKLRPQQWPMPLSE